MTEGPKGRARPAPFIVAVGGTLRPGSSTERALRWALAAAERAGARTKLICGLNLQLPFYQPDNAERSDSARSLILDLRQADGILLGSPGYHGSISGLVKNAVDYVEDLRDDRRPYLTERAVGCIATGAGWAGAVNTLGALRDIVHALRGWPTPMGAALNSTEKIFDSDGACLMPRVAETLEIIAGELITFARRSGTDHHKTEQKEV